MNISRSILVVLLLAACLGGCTSVPMGDPSRDRELKLFTPPAGKAGVYVFRNETIGSAVRMDVLVDGRELGSTAAKTFLYTEVAPGKHRITSKAENSDSVEIDAPAGGLVFLWQEVKMGFSLARTKLHIVTESVGRKGVEESRLAVQ